MKTTAFFILVVFIVCSSGSAQPVPEKKWEFSTSGYFSSMKGKGDSESYDLLNLAMRLGYFVYKGLEIEPEFLLTIPDDSEDTGILFLGNVAYNFGVSKNVTPFILAGFGIGNGARYLSIIWDLEETVTVLDVGVGIKYTVGHSAGLRLEYRFCHVMMEDDDYLNDHQIMVGISLFF
jgi:hypothetical protein